MGQAGQHELVDLVLVFLAVALVLFAVLAGADFGAGILESCKGKVQRREQEELVTRAMGPVWEANHVWLILAVVILFNGFPLAFEAISVHLHIPLTLLLIGITLRGCSFTFRHYDAVKDDTQKVYSRIFAVSSLLTPITLGLVAGGLSSGRIGSEGSSFYAAYIAPWAHVYGLSLGLFLCALFAYVAAVFLCGETRNESLRVLFAKRVQWSCVAAIVTGLLVFGAAEISGVRLLRRFFDGAIGPASMLLATLLLVPVSLGVRTTKRILLTRIAVAAQVTLVLIGWFGLQFPFVIVGPNVTASIDVYEAAAPAGTLRYLLIALVCGSALIFPALGYLFYVFKREDAVTAAEL